MQHYKQGLVKSFATRCGITGLSCDIFGRLNELNLSFQGHDKTIINFINVLSAFQVKRESGEGKMTTSRTEIFYSLNEFLDDTEDMQHDKTFYLNSREYIVSILVSHDILISQSYKRSQSTADAFSVDLAMPRWLFSIT